jgi:monofunctional biosynthetic peptidoglycan transglycosylase
MKCEKNWVANEKISNKLELAVVCSEDQNFLNHHGFDFTAIKKAMKHNEKSKRVRGASTISQQTAKNVFLWQGRSWIRKGFEVYFTFLIETFWSKERILEVYLNVIEMGDGIYGAEAASQAYFNKPASKLNSSQAALIAAVLPNPIKYSAKKPGPFIHRRQQWIIRQMNYWGGELKY